MWLTADGIPVLDHDGLTGGRLRRRAIGDVPRSALPSHIPTLDELLDRCGTGYHLSIDLKDRRAAEAVVRTVSEHDDAMLPRLWLCHPDIDYLIGARSTLGDVRLIDSTRLTRLKEGPERRAARLAEHGIDGINMHRLDWNGGLVVLFHRFERVAFGWDLQFEHELRSGFRMGLDAVYSDHVDVMNDVFVSEVGSNPAPT